MRFVKQCLMSNFVCERYSWVRRRRTGNRRHLWDITSTTRVCYIGVHGCWREWRPGPSRVRKCCMITWPWSCLFGRGMRWFVVCEGTLVLLTRRVARLYEWFWEEEGDKGRQRVRKSEFGMEWTWFEWVWGRVDVICLNVLSNQKQWHSGIFIYWLKIGDEQRS